MTGIQKFSLSWSLIELQRTMQRGTLLSFYLLKERSVHLFILYSDPEHDVNLQTDEVLPIVSNDPNADQSGNATDATMETEQMIVAYDTTEPTQEGLSRSKRESRQTSLVQNYATSLVQQFKG